MFNRGLGLPVGFARRCYDTALTFVNFQEENWLVLVACGELNGTTIFDDCVVKIGN